MRVSKVIKILLMKGLVLPLMDQANTLESSMLQGKENIKYIEASLERFEVLHELTKLQSIKAQLAGFPKTVPLIISSVNDIKKSLKTITKSTDSPKTEISRDELMELETDCRNLGIGAIGYAKVPRKYIFQHKAIRYENAIVLAMEMDKEKLELAPSKETGVMVHKTYNKLGKISLRIAKQLKAKGFGIHAGHALMGQVLYPALAVEAGMGWYGKHGMLITPEFGPIVRLTAIYTSIKNLPFSTENPHAWIEEFCKNCKLCVKKCPPKAISKKSEVDTNGLIKAINTPKCFLEFAENQGCSICLKTCLFNQRGYQKLHKTYLKKSGGLSAARR
jgi:Pyruvate/2-oxoacid:ferredoxin oxidoreductase delta subunit